MKRTLLVLLAAATVAALPACSGGGGRDLVASPTSAPATEATTEAPLPACTDLAGTPVDDLQAEADQFVASCTGPTGQAEALAFMFYDCPDGRRLQWNDYGWGYTGGVWQAHARPDGQLVPPDADMAACS